jgi:hypothetical protein
MCVSTKPRMKPALQIRTGKPGRASRLERVLKPFGGLTQTIVSVYWGLCVRKGEG